MNQHSISAPEQVAEFAKALGLPIEGDMTALTKEPVGGLMGWHELAVVVRQIETQVSYNYPRLAQELCQNLGHAKALLAESQARAAALEGELAAVTARATKAESRAAEAGKFYPADDWHDELFDVLWWTLPIDEPPYVGSPLDVDWNHDYGYTHFQKFNYAGYDHEAAQQAAPTPLPSSPAPAAPELGRSGEGGDREVIGRYEVSGLPVYEDDDYVTDAEGCYLTRAEANELTEEARAAPVQESTPQEGGGRA